MLRAGDISTTTETPKAEEKPIEKKVTQDKVEERLSKTSTSTKTQDIVKDIPTKKSFPTKIAPAAPTVRRFAREIGVDINEVNG